MSNELLWILLVITDFSLALTSFRIFGRDGLYALIAANIIIANIQVLKTITLFGMVTTLGNIAYGSIFLATDMLSEFYGKSAARKGVWIGFFSLVSMTLLMQIALWFSPDASDFAQPHLSGLFSLMPRIAFASLLAYLLSQHHDVWAFHFWKKKTRGRRLWLRNNASTLVSQLIDSIVFCYIAFAGLWPWNVWWQVLFTTYFLKLLVALLDTPVIYAASLLKRNRLPALRK